jgi:uncharacterized protein (TIGR02246 family)
MRNLLALLASIVSVSAALAAPKDEALQVLDKWTKAFNASDVDGIVALYAPDALFIGTGSKSLVTQPDGVRSYFEAALTREKPRGATLLSYETMPLSDTEIIVTGLDNVTGVKDGTAYSRPGRVTFVLAKRGADWKIVHFHRSAMPN